MPQFTCPHCQFILILPDHYAGRTIACPRCGKEVQVPGGNHDRPDQPRDRPPKQMHR